MNELRQIAKDFVDAFNAHDLVKVMSFCSPDLKATSAIVVYGFSELETHWRNIFESYPDVKMNVAIQTVDGATTMTEYVLTGTNTGLLHLKSLIAGGGTVPPTGRRISVRSVSLSTFKDGKVVAHRGYSDRMEVLGQLGLLRADATTLA